MTDTILNAITGFLLGLEDILGRLPLDWVYMPLLLSIALLALRKWRLYKKAESWFNGERFTDAMALLFVLGEVTADYFINNPQLSGEWVALQTAFQALMMNKAYIYVIKPSYTSLRTRLEPKIQLARRLNEELKATPVVPAAPHPDVLPPAYNSVVEPHDFSRR